MTISRLVPQGADGRVDRRGGPFAEAHGQDDGGDADQDAEHGQGRAQPVAGDGLQPRAQGVEPAHAAALRLAHEAAVPEAHYALGRLGHVLLVGDEHDGAPGPVQLVQHAQHVGAGARVQVAGGLVGQQQVGLGHQRAGHRDPLLLPPGQLGGQVVDPVSQAHLLEGLHGPRLAGLAVHPGVDQRQLHVAPGAEVAAAGGTAGTRSRCGGCARRARCSSSMWLTSVPASR